MIQKYRKQASTLLDIVARYVTAVVRGWVSNVFSAELRVFVQEASMLERIPADGFVRATRNSVLYYGEVVAVLNEEAFKFFRPRTLNGGTWFEIPWLMPANGWVDITPVVDRVYLFPGIGDLDSAIKYLEKKRIPYKVVEYDSVTALRQALLSFLGPFISDLISSLSIVHVRVGSQSIQYLHYIANSVVNAFNGVKTLPPTSYPKLGAELPEWYLRNLQNLRNHIEYLIRLGNELTTGHFFSVYSLLTRKEFTDEEKRRIKEKVLPKLVMKELIDRYAPTVKSISYYAKNLYKYLLNERVKQQHSWHY